MVLQWILPYTELDPAKMCLLRLNPLVEIIINSPLLSCQCYRAKHDIKISTPVPTLVYLISVPQFLSRPSEYVDTDAIAEIKSSDDSEPCAPTDTMPAIREESGVEYLHH